MNLPTLIRGAVWVFGQHKVDRISIDQVELVGADLDEMNVNATVRLAPNPENVRVTISSARTAHESAHGGRDA
jgi:hypothetical protein